MTHTWIEELTKSSNIIHCFHDIWTNNNIAQQLKKNAQKLWSVQNVEQTAEAEGIWPTWSDQWTEQQPPYGFCWYLLACLKFCLCETKLTWGKTQMNSNSFTDSDQKNQTTGAETPLNRPEVYRWCTHKEQNNNLIKDKKVTMSMKPVSIMHHKHHEHI